MTQQQGFVAKMIIQQGQWVFLVQGKVANGRPAFWYVIVDPWKVDAFRKALKRARMELTEYGKVIASGWGEEPSEEVIGMLRTRYGLSV